MTSSPAGISCGTTCSASYTSGTAVTLTEVPASGSTFTGWGGPCTGTASTCTVSMTSALSVTAAFTTLDPCTLPSGSISTLFHPLPTARAYAGGTVLSASTPLDIPMLGRGGLPSSGVDAVVVNVEVNHPTASGYISVTPGRTTSQTASQEFTPGTTISNQVTVRLDAAGRLRLRLSAGAATVFVDVAGYYSTAASGDRFHAIATTRANPGGTVVTAGTALHLTLAGHGIPGDATVDAAAVTVEVYAPTSAGYVRVTPDLADSQTAVQEFNARQTISNLATVKLVAGKVQITVSAGSARVFVDVNGYYSVPSVATGYPFHPVTTARVNPGGTTVFSTADLHQQVAGRAGVPSSGISGVVGVIEVYAPTAPGYVRTTPDGVVSQTATQEFVAGQTISNAVAVGLSSAGKIQVHMSTGHATVFVDVAGYFGPIAAATISAGGNYYSCALTSAGAVKCWGANSYGELGNGTTNQSSVPVGVTGLSSGVAGIGLGGGHSCAVTTIGAVKCWGLNGGGELGNGTTTNSSVPVGVTGLGSGASAVSASLFGSCAVTTGDAVKCWGSNLGNGTTNQSSVPVGVTGLGAGAVAVSVGEYHSCALTSAGGVKCWGGNYDGELGNGTTTDSSVPVDVAGLG